MKGQSTKEEAATALMELDRAWARTTTAEDFISFLSDDAIYLLYHRCALFGKKEIGPFFNEVFSRPEIVLDWKAVRVEIRPSGDIGYTTGDWRATWKDADGKFMDITGSYLSVWELQDNGEWKVFAHTENAGKPLFQLREAPSE